MFLFAWCLIINFVRVFGKAFKTPYLCQRFFRNRNNISSIGNGHFWRKIGEFRRQRYSKKDCLHSLLVVWLMIKYGALLGYYSEHSEAYACTWKRAHSLWLFSLKAYLYMMREVSQPCMHTLSWRRFSCQGNKQDAYIYTRQCLWVLEKSISFQYI